MDLRANVHSRPAFQPTSSLCYPKVHWRWGQPLYVVFYEVLGHLISIPILRTPDSYSPLLFLLNPVFASSIPFSEYDFVLVPVFVSLCISLYHLCLSVHLHLLSLTQSVPFVSISPRFHPCLCIFLFLGFVNLSFLSLSLLPPSPISVSLSLYLHPHPLSVLLCVYLYHHPCLSLCASLSLTSFLVSVSLH